MNKTKKFTKNNGNMQIHMINGKEERSTWINPFHSNPDKGDLLDILKVIFPELEFETVNNSNSLFNVTFPNGDKRKMYIDTLDHGGKDNGLTKDKFKVEIPISKKDFQEAIIKDNVTIMNLFIPLKTDDHINFSIDIDNVTLIILNPLQIYSGKGYQQLMSGKDVKISPSSRWVKWEQIKKSFNSENGIYVRPKKARYTPVASEYAYIIHRDQLNNDFFKIFENLPIKYQVKEWILKAEKNNSNKNIVEKAFNLSSKIFRDALVDENEKTFSCSISGCDKGGKSDLVIASHAMDKAYIKSSDISNQEKANLIAEPNNGLLLCRFHDGLFDRGYMSFDEDGNVIIEDGLRTDDKLKTKFIHKVSNEFFEYHRNNIYRWRI